MYVLRIHSRVFGVRWLLITPSTWGATLQSTYSAPEAGTVLDVPGASYPEPLARIRNACGRYAWPVRTVRSPGTYVSTETSTS